MSSRARGSGMESIWRPSLPDNENKRRGSLTLKMKTQLSSNTKYYLENFIRIVLMLLSPNDPGLEKWWWEKHYVSFVIAFFDRLFLQQQMETTWRRDLEFVGTSQARGSILTFFYRTQTVGTLLGLYSLSAPENNRITSVLHKDGSWWIHQKLWFSWINHGNHLRLRILTPCWVSVAQPQGVGGSMQEESQDGPSVEEQKTQRSLRESEVRGSKTNRPGGGCGFGWMPSLVVNIGKNDKKTYENIWKLIFRKCHELLVSSDVESFLIEDPDLCFRWQSRCKT